MSAGGVNKWEHDNQTMAFLSMLMMSRSASFRYVYRVDDVRRQDLWDSDCADQYGRSKWRSG